MKALSLTCIHVLKRTSSPIRSSLLAVILYSCCAKAQAEGVVTSPDEGSLRAALAGGGPVTFATDGTITLSNTLVIMSDTTIDGSGHDVTISGNNSVRIVQVSPGVQLGLQSLVIANGSTNAGAGLYNDGGIVTIANCTFTNNHAGGAAGGFGGIPVPAGQPGMGGAIYNNGTVSAIDTLFAQNTAVGGAGGYSLGPGGPGGAGNGGAVYNLGSFGLTNTSFNGNLANGGSGGAATTGYNPGVPGAASGGAIYSSTAGIASSNCIFVGNVASGGVVGSLPGGRALPYRAAANGGAIYNQTGAVIFASAVFSNNLAAGSPASGGAIYHGGDVLTLTSVTLDDNNSAADRMSMGITSTGSIGSGGALYNHGTANLSDCFVSSNAAAGGAGVTGVGSGNAFGGDGKGGGIYNFGTLTVARSSLVGNSSIGGTSPVGAVGEAYGGGIMTESGAASLVNCTVAGNKAAAGGGTCNAATLTNCTFYGNRGGNVAYATAAINTILAAGFPGNCVGALGDYGHNISSDSSAGFGPGGTSHENTDPKLGPLGNYGGTTPTMPLLAGSPALDHASASAAPSTDQRGRARPYGVGSDIGAYESSPSYVLGGRFAGLTASDAILITLDGAQSTNVSSGAIFRFDNVAAGTHNLTINSSRLVVAPNPLTLTLGPDVLDANFKAYLWNTVNLDSFSNGMARVIYAGTNGQVHRLFASSDLLTWVPIATNTVSAENYYEVADPGSVGQPARFYRSVSP
jgi:fibronectin-binding autotransporter adhesin